MRRKCLQPIWGTAHARSDDGRPGWTEAEHILVAKMISEWVGLFKGILCFLSIATGKSR